MCPQFLSALRQYRRGMQTVASVLLFTFTWLLVSPALLEAQSTQLTPTLGQPPARVEREWAETLATLESHLVRLGQQLSRAEEAHGAHDAIRILHRRLKTLDRQARQTFDRTAQQLRTQGLPAEILARHAAMVSTYM